MSTTGGADYLPRRYHHHVGGCHYTTCTKCGCEYTTTAGTDPGAYVCPDCADYPKRCAAIRARLIASHIITGAGDAEKNGG